MGRRIYLAGPEVFLPDAATMGARKRAICERYGFTGLFPLDNGLGNLDGRTLSAAIFEANMRMIAEADMVVANLTPFRGVSADPGTVFEVGAGFAMGKPVFAYSNRSGTLMERTAALPGTGPLRPADDGRLYAGDGLAVEDFGLGENLMIAEALHRSGTRMCAPERDAADTGRDLVMFERCIRSIPGAVEAD